MVAEPETARWSERVSRQAVLGRIRTALSHEKASAPATFPPYRHAGTLNAAERLRLLESRLDEYDARVFCCSAQDLSERIAAVLLDGGKPRMACPPGVPPEWLDARIAWTQDIDAALSYAEIESFDGVLTGATAAVAESGSIVLQHGPREGRRALTLLPDYHLCVIFADQVVETLPECFERLKESAQRPTTFISGPSATADIEMTRIKGVHGPRFLDVILVS